MTGNSFPAHFSQFSTAAVIVVGDAMLDIYTTGTSTRQMPEAPAAPVVLVGESRAFLGGAANVAANIAALGAPIEFLCLTGADSQRGLMLELAAAQGLATDGFIADDTRPTIAKERCIANGDYVARIDREKTHDAGGAAKRALLDHFDRCLPAAKAVVLSDYCKGTLPGDVIRHIIERSAARNIPVLVDSKKKDFGVFSGATAAKPNRGELAALSRRTDLSQDNAVEEAACDLLNQSGLHNLIASRSEQGVMLVGREGTYRFPATARAVREVSGAGDSLMAACAVACAAGAPLADAVWLGNLAAGLAVEKAETSIVSKEELTAAVLRWDQARKTA